MAKALRNPDIPIDDSCIFDKTTPLVLNQLINHVIWINKIRYCGRNIYIYDDVLGYYRFLKSYEVWPYIHKFFSEDVKECMSPNVIKKLIEALYYAIDIQYDEESFDKNENLINVSNGVLDVETGMLHQKNYEYGFTSCINAKYITDATLVQCPTFKKFIETSLYNDEKSLILLLQCIGVLCSNYNSIKKAIMFIGAPNSGKSKILDFITGLLGEENVCNIPLHKLGNRFNVAELSRHKVNIQAELSMEPIREIETFKNTVGGDTLCGEDKGKPLFYFKNKCKLLFAGNGMPPLKTQDTTKAFISRLVFLIFPNEISVEERDPDLIKKLNVERDIIFSLAMKELQKLVLNGFNFEVPELSAKQVQSYTEQTNHIDDFISECCVLSQTSKVYSRKLYNVYKKFCDDNCFYAYSENSFLNVIDSQKGVTRSRIRIDGERRRGFKGIGLKDSFMQDSQESDMNFNDIKFDVPSVPERRDWTWKKKE